MTLVVAQATDDGPRIVSDTRLTFPEDRPPFPPRPTKGFKAGMLKSIVVQRDTVVCFAGEVDDALEAIRYVARELQHGEPLDGLLPHLQAVAQAVASNPRRDDLEFIVATNQPASQLTRVRCNSIERGLDSAWIGNHGAFERFQEARHAAVEPSWAELESKLPASTREGMRLRQAMQTVIDDPTIESVDDFCVSIVHRHDGFQYLESTFIHVGRNITIQPGDDLISRMAQPVEEGGYAVSVVEPAEPGTPALGLSFPRARLGMLFLPLRYDDVQVIQDVSPNDYARVVQEWFGVAMKDPLLRHA